MTDLFAAAECHREERAAILAHCAGIPRSTAEAMADRESEEWRHKCEVRSVVRMYQEQGKAAVVDFLADVEKHRGKAAMERLRTDALAALGR